MNGAGQFVPVRLETTRLYLRPIEPGDIEAIVSGCSDELTQRWLPLPRPYTRSEAIAWSSRSESIRSSGQGLPCAAALKDTDEMVAWIGLKKTDWASRVTEVGYWAVPEHRGQGYVTEGTRALSAWALTQGMERVELVAAPANVASNRVAVRAGFYFEGVKRNAGHIHEGRVDLNLYSLIALDLF